MIRNFETFFCIETNDSQDNILTGRLSIDKDNGLVKYYSGKKYLEEFPLSKVSGIYLIVYGPMDSFGSNCGEIKERIY